MFVFDTKTFSEPQGTLELLATAEVMRTTFKPSMIVEVVEAGMEAGIGDAEGVGVRGHPGETGNAATEHDQGAKIDQLENAATEHDQGAKINQLENGHAPDPGNSCYSSTHQLGLIL